MFHLGDIVDLRRVRRDLHLYALAEAFQLLPDVPRPVQTSHLDVVLVAPLPRQTEHAAWNGMEGRGGTRILDNKTFLQRSSQLAAGEYKPIVIKKCDS